MRKAQLTLLILFVTVLFFGASTKTMAQTFTSTAITDKNSSSPYATTKNVFPDEGQCTWYVFGRVIELAESGQLDPSASTIMYNAFQYKTGRHARYWPTFLGGTWTPTTQRALPMDKRKPGMIAVWIAGEFGHVGFVEEISSDKKRYRLSDFNRTNDESYRNIWYNFEGTSDKLINTYPSFYQLPLPVVGSFESDIKKVFPNTVFAAGTYWENLYWGAWELRSQRVWIFGNLLTDTYHTTLKTDRRTRYCQYFNPYTVNYTAWQYCGN